MVSSLPSTFIARPWRRYHPIFHVRQSQKVREFRFCAKSPSDSTRVNTEEPESGNVLLKIAWYGSELLEVAASFLRSPSKASDSVGDVELYVDGLGKIDGATVVETIKEDFVTGQNPSSSKTVTKSQ